MSKIIKLKDTLLDDTSINYPKIIDLNDIHYDSRGKRLQVHWFPTVTAGQKNGPNGSDGIVLSFCPHEDYIYQLAWLGGSPSRVFTRSKYVSVWYPWKELLLKEDLPAIPPLVNPIISIKATGGASMSWGTAWTWQTVPLNNCVCNYGGCFTHESYGVRIGAGVKTVRVSCCFNWYNVSITQSDTNVTLAINGANGAYGIGYANTPDYYGVVSGEVILNVNQGDLIQLQVNKGATGSCNIFDGSRMIVEKIA